MLPVKLSICTSQVKRSARLVRRLGSPVDVEGEGWPDRDQPRRRPLAGVSQPTVSRALRDNPTVSRRDQARVREAARAARLRPERDRPRAVQRAAPAGSGCCVTDLENQFYAQIIAPDPPRARAPRLSARAAHRDRRHRDGRRTTDRQRSRRRASWPRRPSTRWCRCGCATAACRSSTSIAPPSFVEADATVGRPAPRDVRAAARASSPWDTGGSAPSSDPATPAPRSHREIALRDALDEHGLTLGSAVRPHAVRSTSTAGDEATTSLLALTCAADGDRLRQRRGRLRRPERGAPGRGLRPRRRLDRRLRRPAGRVLADRRADDDRLRPRPRWPARPPACSSRAHRGTRSPDRRTSSSTPPSSSRRHARRRTARSDRRRRPTWMPCALIVHTHTLRCSDLREHASRCDDQKEHKVPLDPIAYKPYADPDDFIREVTDLIWVDRAIGYIRENYEPDSIVHGAYGTSTSRDEVIEGTLMRISATPGPHRSGRGRHLGGARRRRVPQLAPRPVRSTSQTSEYSRTIANCLYRRGRMVEEWVVRDSLADRAAAGPRPRRTRARRKAFRGYTGSLTERGPDRRDRRRATPGHGPTTTAPRSRLVLEMIQTVWNDRDLEKVETFFAPRPGAAHRRQPTRHPPEGYRRALLRCSGRSRPGSSRSATSRPTTTSATPDCGRRHLEVRRRRTTASADFGPLTGTPVDVLGVSQFLVPERPHRARGAALRRDRPARADRRAPRRRARTPHQHLLIRPTQTRNPTMTDRRRSRSTDRPRSSSVAPSAAPTGWPATPPSSTAARPARTGRRTTPSSAPASRRTPTSSSTSPSCTATTSGPPGCPTGSPTICTCTSPRRSSSTSAARSGSAGASTASRASTSAHDGDIISVPTWIFRGFTNEGPDDGILLTVLGHDVTGGIIWGPSVLQGGRVVRSAPDRRQPADRHRRRRRAARPTSPLIKPMKQKYIDELTTYTVEEMRRRVIQPGDRVYSRTSLLCASLPGGGAELASAIGYGMTRGPPPGAARARAALVQPGLAAGRCRARACCATATTRPRCCW